MQLNEKELITWLETSVSIDERLLMKSVINENIDNINTTSALPLTNSFF